MKTMLTKKHKMKIILLFIILGIGYVIIPHDEQPTTKVEFGLRNIRTDKIETYQPTAFCWWCSCYVSEPLGNPRAFAEYLKLVVKE